MTNSTATYWDIDGESLQTYAWNIETLGGDRLSPPPLRGSNLIVPQRHGRRWMPKVVDQKTIQLGMWVLGCEEDGDIPTNAQMYRQFEENWRHLQRLLFTPRKQVTLTKRFYDNGVLKTASALAQFDSGLRPSMTGGTRAAFTVTLELADPYFYAPEVTTNLSTGANSVTVDGDDMTSAIKIEVAGVRSNVKVRNATLGVEMQYAAELDGGDTLVADVYQYSATTDPSLTPAYDSTGSIVHAGDVAWLLLRPGTNNIVVSSDSGSGAVVMKHKAAWW